MKLKNKMIELLENDNIMDCILGFLLLGWFSATVSTARSIFTNSLGTADKIFAIVSVVGAFFIATYLGIKLTISKKD